MSKSKSGLNAMGNVAGESAGETQDIALTQLVRSDSNVRKTAAAEDIEELAAMILAQGLIQNLTVHLVSAAKGKKPAIYGVGAGGRRLAALQLLAKRGQIEKDYPVRCLVVGSDRAVEYSIAENQHAPMHPADEFVAFKALADDGKDIEDIAARFGTTPMVVQRRLKLANLAPEFIVAFREGHMSLAALMVLASVDSHEEQRAAFSAVPKYARSNPEALRQALSKAKWPTTHKLARFVGVDAYEKAGGIVDRDIFDDQGGGYIADIALLQQLADQKVARKIEKLTKEGHQFVEVLENGDYSELQGFANVEHVLRPATEAEQEEMNDITAKLLKIEADIEACEDADPDKAETLSEDYDTVRERIDEIEETRSIPDPDEAAAAGAVMWIDHNGKITTKRNVLRREDATRLRRHRRVSDSTDDSAGAPGKGIHSEALIRRLTAHRTLALQAELAQRSDVALVAITASLAADAFHRHAGGVDWLKVRGAYNSAGQHITGDDSKAAAAMDAMGQTMEETYGEHIGNLFEHLLARPQSEVLSLLAYALARNVDAVQSREGHDNASSLARAVGLDMNRWWTPTGVTYLSSVSKSALLSIVNEAGAAADADELGKLKKGELVTAVETRLAGTNWLPALLRSHAA